MEAVRAKIEVSMGNVLFDQGIVPHGSALRVKAKSGDASGAGERTAERYNPNIIY
jgi:hypothetical protein